MVDIENSIMATKQGFENIFPLGIFIISRHRMSSI